MRLQKQDVAAGFRQIAELLEANGAEQAALNVFHGLADTVAHLPLVPHPAGDETHPGERELPIFPASSLGAYAAASVVRYLESGELPGLDTLAAIVSPVLDDSGTGRLHSHTRAGRAVGLPFLFAPRRYTPLQLAMPIAEDLRARVAAHADIREAVIVGECRRARATVERIDLVAVSDKPSETMHSIANEPTFSATATHGTLTLPADGDLPVTVHFTTPQGSGAALARLTGSPAHTVAVERIAAGANIQLMPSGVFQHGHRLATHHEQDVYDLLELDRIPPELREDRGEIEAARNGELPCLVEMSALRGDLRCQPRNLEILAEMAGAAAARGDQYLAIMLPEASGEAAHAWLDAAGHYRPGSSPPVRLLNFADCDVLEEGRLATTDDVLARLDFVVCAVRSHLALGQRQQTERLVRAMDQRACRVLALPSPPCVFDLERVMRAARAHDCVLIMGSTPLHPAIQDLRWRMARDIGVKIALGSGARDANELETLRFEVGQARRGWLEADQVINTLPLEKLQKQLRPH